MGDDVEDDSSWIDEMYSSVEDAPSGPESDGECFILYRPVGQVELDLIAEKGFSAFPPRLSFQPIFYPVLNIDYAAQIARDWNTKDEASGFVGYVTRFRVRKAFLDRYEIHKVGGAIHVEYWIPAADLSELNRSIEGGIEVVRTFKP